MGGRVAGRSGGSRSECLPEAPGRVVRRSGVSVFAPGPPGKGRADHWGGLCRGRGRKVPLLKPAAPPLPAVVTLLVQMAVSSCAASPASSCFAMNSSSAAGMLSAAAGRGSTVTSPPE